MSTTPQSSPTLSPLAFWRLKLRQLLHDPPGKPFLMRLKGGHKLGSQKLLAALLEKAPQGTLSTRPDRIMTGADRAVLPYNSAFSANRGLLPVQGFSREAERCLTHPLCAGPVLQPGDPGDLTPQNREVLLEDSLEAAESLQLSVAEWNDEKLLKAAFFRIWRRLREELIAPPAAQSSQAWPGNLLWERMPADTRQPDHAIWEHNRLTSALAFAQLPMKRLLPPEGDTPVQEPLPPAAVPWLLTLSLGPVQDFIAESRKAQDLWTSSMMLADLFLRTVAPLIEAYGPDCILYPELNGNPHMDRWLLQQDWLKQADVLRDGANPTTFAGILPNTCVAVVPRGETHPDSALKPLEDLARQCQARMKARWDELAAQVKGYLQQAKGGESWSSQWDEQHHTGRLYVVWSAVEWTLDTPRHAPLNLVGALPGQDWAELQKRAGHPDPTKQARDTLTEKNREARLKPWVHDRVWQHYQLTREVFGKTELAFLQGERGFDYALTHHQLFLRHAMRKQAGRPGAALLAPGEKCSLCHTRAALTGRLPERERSTGHSRALAASEQLRAQATHFWRDLDPEEKGSERLCAICAMKRFLVPAGGQDRGLNPTWAGNKGAFDASDDRKARVPFPSSTALATQQFIVDICTHPGMRRELERVVQAYRATGAGETAFPAALPRLRALEQRFPELSSFLRIEPQFTVLPQASVTEAKRQEKDAQKDAWQALARAVKELRKKASELEIAPPNFRYAIIRMDGDSVSQLLLGDPETLQARWEEVLHPAVVARIQADLSTELEQPGTEEGNAGTPPERARPTWQALGWSSQLRQQRLMGPSLHAFISRTLADFSHRIVPWVVEREFDGRLIYAGGDDILALAPADQALCLVARLQQLYGCAWVIDRDHRPDAWGWRRQSWGDSDSNQDDEFVKEPHLRFVGIQGLERLRDRRQPLQLPVPERNLIEPIVCPGRTLSRTRPPQAEGVVLPMMGAHHTLSAGVVYAHHKTPLEGLLKHSKELLDRVAKKESGPGSVALARYSRTGVKECVALPWKQPFKVEGRRDKAPSVLPFVREGESFEAHVLLEKLIGAFKESAPGEGISGRFPYKLRTSVREHAPLLTRLLLQDARSFKALQHQWQSQAGLAPHERAQDTLVLGEPDNTERLGVLQAFKGLKDAESRRRYLAALEKQSQEMALENRELPSRDRQNGAALSLQSVLLHLLRDAAELKRPETADETQEQSLGGLPLDALLYLWLEGLQRALPELQRPGTSPESVLERSLDVFLFCRALAGSEEDAA